MPLRRWLVNSRDSLIKCIIQWETTCFHAHLFIEKYWSKHRRCKIETKILLAKTSKWVTRLLELFRTILRKCIMATASQNRQTVLLTLFFFSFSSEGLLMEYTSTLAQLASSRTEACWRLQAYQRRFCLCTSYQGMYALLSPPELFLSPSQLPVLCIMSTAARLLYQSLLPYRTLMTNIPATWLGKSYRAPTSPSYGGLLINSLLCIEVLKETHFLVFSS